ncbi:hypothetical protein Tco_0600375 [Tanacetum coccineum]|uniref:Uncharacterized protein n=1 Tax=Tanacetum coccineum TaxID=301880 RepID=A0ABQ4WBM2_9ASTR
MFCEPDTYRRDLLENLDTLEAVIHRAVITYARLQLQSQDVQINPVQAVDDSLIVSKSSWIESENNHALGKSVNETQLQQHESLVPDRTTLEANLNMYVKALDVESVITESSGTKSDKHDTSSSSGTYIIHAVDADIRLVNDQVLFAEVQLATQHNVLANEQQHTEQSKPIYDTYLLEKVDSNTTPDSTNMCHRGGEIDQDAEQYQGKSPLLKAEFLKMNDMVEKEVYNELSNRFLQLEKHCISLEISMQQKEESFQSNKPCKNQEHPEFCEFFEINDLKVQLQDKTTLICNLKNQIKSVKEASNEAKVKHEIDVLETINIELESSVAKLLAENEKLNKENEHLKQTYKELYDSIKKTRIQTKDHNDSLIAQVNSKTVENADLKAQIQEKVFANVALKNELRKLKGNSVDTKNSQEEPYGLNDMDHNHYLEEARKKTQERNRNSKPSVMHTTSLQNTTNGSKPNPRSNNQISRSLPVSKSSCGMSNGVSLVDHSRNSSSFSDSKHFVCSTCHKCVFNANHDNCITKFLKEVNSRAKVQSPKTRNNNKPVEPKSHTQKPGRQIAIGQRFSLNKSSAVHEKPNTPRSCLRWIPTGRIFKLASLRWIPIRKLFDSCTSKVDSEPPNGPNDDITNPYECNQALNVSAGTLNLSAVQASLFNDRWRLLATLQSPLLKEKKGLVQNSVSPTTYVPPSKRDYEIMFQPLFDEYFNPPPCAVSPNPVAVAAPRPVDPAGSPLSTTIDQDVPSANPSSEETTLQGVIPSNLHHLNQSFDTLTKLTKNHPLDNVIGDPSRSVLIRSQLHEHAIWCYFYSNDNPIPFGGKRSG